MCSFLPPMLELKPWVLHTTIGKHTTTLGQNMGKYYNPRPKLNILL